jgi:hypothetical protein
MDKKDGKGVTNRVRWRGRPAADVVLGGAILAIPFCAMAGPPFQTDDPEPVPLGHFEFYVASQQTLTQDGRSGTLPHLEFNYGAAKNLQVHIVAPYAFDHPSGGSRVQGYGDTELGAKYRFIEEGDDTPQVGVFPLYIAPTGDDARGLGNGASQFYLPVWLQKSWGPWTSYGGAGYLINQAAGSRNSWFIGWEVQRELSEVLTLGAEVFHRTELVDGAGSSDGFNVGAIVNFDEHNHLLFSAGKGLRNASATNKASSYLAYQVTY